MADLSIEPGPLNITGEQSRTWSLRFTVTTNGTALNLTGYDCAWALVPMTGGTAVMTAGTADGITLGGTAGTIAFTRSPTDTAGAAVGQYRHEFKLIEPGGGVPPFVGGIFNVTDKVL